MDYGVITVYRTIAIDPSDVGALDSFYLNKVNTTFSETKGTTLTSMSLISLKAGEEIIILTAGPLLIISKPTTNEDIGTFLEIELIKTL